MVEWWQQHRFTLGVALAAALVGAGLALLLARREPPPLRVVQPTTEPTPAAVLVHVSGAVASPGVYRLVSTARIGDAVDAAGGALEQGDPQALNLAGRVRDGQRIEVPERAQETTARSQSDGRPRATGQSAPARVNLNRADQAQLESLPGIGPVTARRILEHRDTVGHFERVEQLQEARLVNRGLYERIKDLVTVE